MALLGWIPATSKNKKNMEEKSNDERKKKDGLATVYLKRKLAPLNDRLNANISKNPQKAKKYFTLVFALLLILCVGILIIKISAANMAMKNSNIAEEINKQVQEYKNIEILNPKNTKQPNKQNTKVSKDKTTNKKQK